MTDNFKMILEGNPENMVKGLTVGFQIISRNPQQKIGTSYGIRSPEGFVVIRNRDSYLVKELLK